MARKDLPCADCGTLMWRSSTSAPEGVATCHPCRRKRPRYRSDSPNHGARLTSWECQGCGKHCERKPTKGQLPKWCDDCRAASAWQLTTFTCAHCGVVTTGTGKKFCSVACSNRSKPKRPKKPKAPAVRTRSEPKAKFSHVRFPQCVMCGQLFCTRYTVSTCSDACKRAKVTADRGNARHKRRALRRDSYIEPVHWRLLYREDGPACHLCGFDTDPDDYKVTIGADGRQVFIAGLEYPSVDHVLALSQGGAHSRSNARLAHMYCNAVKCAHPLASVA